jgi:hypothetical protein
MNRIIPWIALVLAGSASVAACSSASSPSGGAISPKVCALVSACGSPGAPLFTFGVTCEELDVYATVDASLLGTSGALTRADLACADAANDCASLQACFTVPAADAAKCAGSTKEQCVNGYAVLCDQPKLGGLTQGNDCGRAGLVCAADAEGASCGTASCDPTTTMASCDGDNLVTCSEPGGVLLAANCKASAASSCTGSGTSGGTCQTQVAETCAVVNGTAMCVGTGAACDATVKNTCDGTSIVSCTGGKLARFDCTTEAANTTCKVGSDGSAQCVGAGTECTDTTPEACADGVITYCMWGEKTTVDCKSYGLSGCAIVTTGLGGKGATCTP